MCSEGFFIFKLWEERKKHGQRKEKLMTPGPTPIPWRVQQALNKPMIGHRSQEFTELFNQTAPRLKPIFGTQEEVYLVTGSGTSGLEMAVVNVLSPGDEILVVVSGAFGDRFAKICELCGFITHRLDVEWGNACEPDTLKAKLAEFPKVKAVAVTYCETSTGVLHPVAELVKSVKEHSDALFIVDGVSCIAGVESRMDEWNVDILVTGSQKAFMLPPGLAFISASKRAWRVIEQNETRSFYFDLKAYKDSYAKKMTPYTPAVSLIHGLVEVCDLIEEEGWQEVINAMKC